MPILRLPPDTIRPQTGFGQRFSTEQVVNGIGGVFTKPEFREGAGNHVTFGSPRVSLHGPQEPAGNTDISENARELAVNHVAGADLGLAALLARPCI